MAAWDLLQLPVLSADQWEANRAKAKEDDAAHADDLLTKACEWQVQSAEASSTATTSGQEEQPSAPEHHQGATAAGQTPLPPRKAQPELPRMAPPGAPGLGEGGDLRRVEGGPSAVATRGSFEGEALDRDQRLSSRLERNNAVIYGSREAASGLEVGGGATTGAARRGASDLVTR